MTPACLAVASQENGPYLTALVRAVPIKMATWKNGKLDTINRFVGPVQGLVAFEVMFFPPER